MLLKPIHNYYNCFCYYISAIQRLRSSQTLVDKLKNKTELDKLTPLDKNMLWLLINYDKVELDKAQNEFINIIKYKFNQKLKSGGCPYKILTKLFAPIIFKFYRDDFEKILNELNLQHKHFSNVVSEKDFEFTTNENYNKRLYQDYCQMLEVPFQVTLSRFKVGVLCIYFSDVYARNYKNKEEPSFNSGHAVTITLSTDDKFYVLDDSHMLVYCGATCINDFTEDESERDEYGEKQIVAVSKMMGSKLKTLTSSVLCDIEGIGKTKAKLLLEHFGSVNAIAEASEEEIVSLKGISKNNAANIYKHFLDFRI